MKKLSWIVFALALIGAGVAGWSQSEFPVTVSELSIEGTVKIRDRDLLDVIGFRAGDVIEAADLKAASQAIFDLGWFSEVMPRIDSEGHVTFRVVENPVIREIVIAGNVHLRPFRILGIRLFEYKIMSTSKIRSILRQNDVKTGEVLNRISLESALQDVLQEYKDRGYVLVMVGEIEAKETLTIEFIEGKVAGHRIEGLTSVPTETVEAMIDIPLDVPLRQEDLQRTLQRIHRSIYFSDVEVVPAKGQAKDAVFLRWKLTERRLISEPVSVGAIELTGITQFEPATVERRLGPVPESTIGNFDLLRILEGVYDLYYDSGYIMTRFSVGAVDGRVLPVRVEEGRISEIVITGNTRTNTYVVSRNLKVRVGDVLDRDELRVDYQKLSSLGYFGSIDLLPEWTEEGVKLTVRVSEKEHLGGMNGAVALDPSTGQLVGELSVNQKNLFGTGQDVSISYRRGLGSGAEAETSTWNLGYSTVAYFPDFERVSLDLYQNVKGIGEEGSEESIVTLGSRLSFRYPVADYSSLGLSYKHEETRLEGERIWSPIDAVTVSLSYNSVDDPTFPTDGERRTASVEKAGGFAAGIEYAKVDLTWAHFSAVDLGLFGSRDQVIAVRFKAGIGDRGLPATQLYELGGPMTVRGTPSSAVHQMLVSNFEYRLEVTEGLVVSGFFDAGLDLRSVRPADTLASTGIEIGVSAAGMYVRLDLVWPIGDEMRWLPRFDFGFGPMF